MTGYEKRDIRFSTIAKSFGGVAILLAIVALVCAGALRLLSSHFPAELRRPIPPPEPRLQADPVAELRLQRAEEDAVLGGYGWVDRSRGVIRLPIERAMALLLQRGLPTRAASPRPRP
jgi:hypothetical protein